MQRVDDTAERRVELRGEGPEAEGERVHAASNRSSRVKRSSVRAMTAA